MFPIYEIRLTKKFLRSCDAGSGFRLNDDWVTNGHWLLARRILHPKTNALLASIVDAEALAAVDAVLRDLRDDVKVFPTQQVYISKCTGDQLLFASAEGKTRAWIQRHYADAFKQEGYCCARPSKRSPYPTLWLGDDRGPALVIMPCREPELTP